MAPSNIKIQRMEKPSEELVEEAVQLFCELMSAGPAAISLTAGKLELMQPMARAMIRPLALLAGEMYTATDENGSLVGFTLWLPPGENMFTTEEQRQMGLYEFMNALPEEGKAYYSTTLGQDFPKVVDEYIGIPSAQTACYWCNFAMVRADYQGKGVAKALFQLVFHKAKEMGAVVGLGTTNLRNVEIYKKIGLTLRGHRYMHSPWGDWPTWIFSKDMTATE
ncbi:hypothetical protein OBBRIDRAFT_793938 [Obba rivulosa]|uniref:N-acetyltransferase domain-containing protein n=1 Tax=Obba rivulosa TaxID=1052685 RepID=A0A8E2ASX4_9APHY|nr:hypothetical protein OBBRIDRAFT_793938 [Obba rivulosa]